MNTFISDSGAVYDCTPESCGYEGGKVCQNCGYAEGEV